MNILSNETIKKIILFLSDKTRKDQIEQIKNKTLNINSLLESIDFKRLINNDQLQKDLIEMFNNFPINSKLINLAHNDLLYKVGIIDIIEIINIDTNNNENIKLLQDNLIKYLKSGIVKVSHNKWAWTTYDRYISPEIIIVAILIVKLKKNLNFEDKNNDSFIGDICYYLATRFDLIRLVLENGANINNKINHHDKKFDSVLDFALSTNNIYLTSLFIEFNASFKNIDTDKYYQNPYFAKYFIKLQKISEINDRYNFICSLKKFQISYLKKNLINYSESISDIKRFEIEVKVNNEIVKNTLEKWNKFKLMLIGRKMNDNIFRNVPIEIMKEIVKFV